MFDLTIETLLFLFIYLFFPKCQRFNTSFNTLILLLLSLADLLGEETTHLVLMILNGQFNAQLDLAHCSVHCWALAVTCLILVAAD